MNESRHVLSQPALLLIVSIASLFGVLVGGGIVYLAVRTRLTPPSIQAPVETRTWAPVHVQAEGVRAVDVQSAVTEAVAKLSPTVVTVINHLATGGFNPFCGRTDSHARACGTSGLV